MTKRATAKASIAAECAAKQQEAAARMEEFRTARTAAALNLASIVEPLAAAIVSLTEEAESTLSRLQKSMASQETSITERCTEIEKAVAALSEVAPILLRASRRLESVKTSESKPWIMVLMMSILAPLIAVASIASWIWLDGPALLNGNAELLGLGRQVQEAYLKMSPERQAMLRQLLENPTGR